MRNVLALIGAVVVGFGGAGWYLGWYKMNVSKGSDGNPEIKTTLDTKKVVEDSGAALKQAGALIGEQIDKAANDAKQPPAGTPGPTTTPQSANTPSVFWPAKTPDTKKVIQLVTPKR